MKGNEDKNYHAALDRVRSACLLLGYGVQESRDAAEVVMRQIGSGKLSASVPCSNAEGCTFKHNQCAEVGRCLAVTVSHVGRRPHFYCEKACLFMDECEAPEQCKKAPSSTQRSAELEQANVGLADEAARMRIVLGELVAASNAFYDREDMTAAEEEAAEQRWEAALKAAEPFTEESLLAGIVPSATRRSEDSNAG